MDQLVLFEEPPQFSTAGPFTAAGAPDKQTMTQTKGGGGEGAR